MLELLRDVGRVERAVPQAIVRRHEPQQRAAAVHHLHERARGAGEEGARGGRGRDERQPRPAAQGRRREPPRQRAPPPCRTHDHSRPGANTSKEPPAVVAKISGAYILSACAGARMNVPGVVARQRTFVRCVPAGR